MTARHAQRSRPTTQLALTLLDSPRGRVFRQQGEYWTIVYGGTLFRLKDSKGVRYLAYLLAHPSEPISSGDLISVAGGHRVEARSSAERARLSVTKRIKASMEKIGTLHPALANHLRTRIKTGYLCTYIGESDKRCRWTLT